MRKLIALLVLSLPLCACVPSAIPPSVQRSGTTVNASFGKSWNAVVDVLTERNIPIKTIDRTSGLIATDQLSVTRDMGVDDAADCGKDAVGVKAYPTNASYNVLVRGDSSTTVVRVTTRWVRIGKSRSFGSTDNVSEECGSTGAWETDVERRIKAIAEKK